MRKLDKEQKDKLFVINLERILADKNMSKKELAEKLHCTPQTISNYSKRGVPETVALEIADALGVSEKELYRTEAENEFCSLKKINIENGGQSMEKQINYGSYAGYKETVGGLTADLQELLKLSEEIALVNTAESIRETLQNARP